MTGPRLSGWCGNGQAWGHARCRLDGCTCTCHTAPTPRPRVALTCLQGRHTATCGHTIVAAGLELTVQERARVIAAHLELDPAAALDVVRQILTERTVTP